MNWHGREATQSNESIFYGLKGFCGTQQGYILSQIIMKQASFIWILNSAIFISSELYFINNNLAIYGRHPFIS